MTRGVSVSGLYPVIDEPLIMGDRLALIMSVLDPDHPESSIPLRLKARGRVVRVVEAREAAGVGIALDEGSGYLARAS